MARVHATPMCARLTENHPPHPPHPWPSALRASRRAAHRARLAMPILATLQRSDDGSAGSDEHHGAGGPADMPGSPAPGSSHDPWGEPSDAPGTMHVYMLHGDRYVPSVSALRACGRAPANVHLPEDTTCCTVRTDIRMTPGSHAFVVVPGERQLRMSPRHAAFGRASGHAQLACEGRVLFAGEVLLGAHNQLLAWCNMSGTYLTPREYAAQLDLPLELLWSTLLAEELRQELHLEEGTPLAAGHALDTLLDARFGRGNHLQVEQSDVVLVRDIARGNADEKVPLRPDSWRPVARRRPSDEGASAAIINTQQ